MFAMKMPRSYELTLSADYVASWGVMEAIRELLQNALDSDSPFEVEFKSMEGHYSMHITSRHESLPINSLILGNTSKAQDSDSIGNFGEGYKLAMLVLKRNEKGCMVFNGDKIWEPNLEWSEQFGCNLLRIYERKFDVSKRPHSGLEFVVDRLTFDEVVEIRQSCLHLRGEQIADELFELNAPEVVKASTHGRILKEAETNLYVNGLFVCELKDYDYSYDIKPEFLKLERDRKTVDNFDLGVITTQMWYATEQYDEIARMIDNESEDVYYARYNSPQMVKDACWRLFQKQYPGHIPAESKQQLERLVSEGFTKVVVVNRGMYAAVSKSEGLQKAAPTFELSPLGQLQVFFKKNRSLMRRRAIVEFKALMQRAEKERWY